jgi:hypothetical protein
MARVSIRVIGLAAWCVIAAVTVGATAPPDAVDALTLASSEMAAHAPQGLLAAGHATPARHRAIRHARSGARQLFHVRSSVAVTARSNHWASRMSGRRVHVPARHLLRNLTAPRAPAASLL